MFFVGRKLKQLSESLGGVWNAFFSQGHDDTTEPLPPHPFTGNIKEAGLRIAEIIGKTENVDSARVQTIKDVFSGFDSTFSRTGTFGTEGLHLLSCVIGCLKSSTESPSLSAQLQDSKIELEWLEELFSYLPKQPVIPTPSGDTNPVVYTLIQWASMRWGSMGTAAASSYLSLIEKALLADPRLDVVGPPDRLRFEASVFQLANACKKISGASWLEAQIPIFNHFTQLLPLLDECSVGQEHGLRAGALVRGLSLFDRIPEETFLAACDKGFDLPSFDPSGPSGPNDSGGAILSVLLGWRGKPVSSQVPFSIGENQRICLGLKRLVERGANPNLKFNKFHSHIPDSFFSDNEHPLAALFRFSETWNAEAVDDMLMEQMSALIAAGAVLEQAFSSPETFVGVSSKPKSSAFVRACSENKLFRQDLENLTEETDSKGKGRRRI